MRPPGYEPGELPTAPLRDFLHSIGITLVEIGVTIGVACTIITIINALTERIAFDDEL